MRASWFLVFFASVVRLAEPCLGHASRTPRILPQRQSPLRLLGLPSRSSTSCWKSTERRSWNVLGMKPWESLVSPGRRYFRKDNPSGIRTHQVHAFGRDSAEIERHIAFRDYLIAHAAEAAAYDELKRGLAREHPNNMEAYMDGKDAFIKEHEAKAILWRSHGQWCAKG